MRVALQSGSMREVVSIPRRNLLKASTPERERNGAGLDPAEMVADSLRDALESQRVGMRLGSRSTVSIVVDDITRPTPTGQVLPVLLQELGRRGVPEGRITITVGNGLHRRVSDQEMLRLIGREILSRHDVAQNDGRDERSFEMVANTSRGTPVYLNKRVARSDLVLTIGTVKPHSFAGYTGGAKSILPGVCGRQTILHNHSYRILEFPNGLVGEADGSVPRQDMEDAARQIPAPLVAVNTVLDCERKIVAVFSGDVVAAHRKAAGLFQKLYSVELAEPADVVLLEGRYPSSESLYFSLSNMAAVLGTRRPVVGEGGMVILVSQCLLGIGADVVERLFEACGSPAGVLEHLRTHGTSEGQWAAQHLAFYLTRRRVGIVSQGLSKQKAEGLHMAHYPSVKAAIEEAGRQYGPDARILLVRNPDLLYRAPGNR